MATTPSFSVDDKDLDDAELWAVIDSAAASHSSSRSSKPLALKHASPQPHFRALTLYQSPKISESDDAKLASDGEVLQERERESSLNQHHHHRPHKIARSSANCVEDNRVVVAKPLPRTPKTPLFSSPESGRVSVRELVSPVSDSSVSPVFSGREERMHSLAGQFPSVSLFKDCQNAAMAILEKGDYTTISGSPFIKKSGWRKIAFYFNISFEIRDKSIEFDDNRNVQRAEFIVRAHMQGGRFSDGWGSCERREKRFMKPNHDIPSTAETRAKSKACQCEWRQLGSLRFEWRQAQIASEVGVGGGICQRGFARNWRVSTWDLIVKATIFSTQVTEKIINDWLLTILGPFLVDTKSLRGRSKQKKR